MRYLINISMAATIVLTMLCVTGLFARDMRNDAPVSIAFDEKAIRMDLLTSQQIPSYEWAQRGSIQFHLWNVHESQDYLTYLHDGIRKAPVTGLISMEKAQQQFSVWIISFQAGGRNSPRVRELAVSFIPLVREAVGNEIQYKPGQRVYVLLNDLKRIDWGVSQ